MKKLFQISFFLLISVIAFAQEKKDSVETRKFSLFLNGGINTAEMTYSWKDPRYAKNNTNEFFELDGTYARNSFIKVSLGVAYHHLSNYADYRSLGNSSFLDLKMASIPIHVIFPTNENNKIFFHFYTGAEFGFISKDIVTDSNNNKVEDQFNLQYNGLGIFFCIGTDVNYSFNKHIALGLGVSYRPQINSFSYWDEPTGPYSDPSHYEYLSISYGTVSINVKYKFK